MGVKEAITQLEIIATNMVGRLCEIPNEDERQVDTNLRFFCHTEG